MTKAHIKLLKQCLRAMSGVPKWPQIKCCKDIRKAVKSKAMKYTQQRDGDVVTPVMKGYKMMCCDCGLVHVLDFFVTHHGRGHKVKFRVRRHVRATAAARSVRTKIQMIAQLHKHQAEASRLLIEIGKIQPKTP